jgi:hypothetical protein
VYPFEIATGKKMICLCLVDCSLPYEWFILLLVVVVFKPLLFNLIFCLKVFNQFRMCW